PGGLVETEGVVPDGIEESGEGGDEEAASRERDRSRNRKWEWRQAEGFTEPPSQPRLERDVRERHRRAEVHRVDEQVRRRGGVFERVRRVPAPVPFEPEPEREEVEDDGEPQEAERRVEADRYLVSSGRAPCS